jgi:hypothetical protein
MVWEKEEKNRADEAAKKRPKIKRITVKPPEDPLECDDALAVPRAVVLTNPLADCGQNTMLRKLAGTSLASLLA